jgi:hypothetical protein
MNIVTTLEARFSGTEADDPIKEEDLRRFEKKWKRSIPAVYREFLLEVNGIGFDPEVNFREMSKTVFLPLSGIDVVLRRYGEYAYSFLLPFATSEMDGGFFLDARGGNSAVYTVTPIFECYPDRIVFEKVAESLADFIEELK